MRVVAGRLLQLLATSFGVILLTFVAVRLIPGDPIAILLGDVQVTPEASGQMRTELGIDRSIGHQFLKYLGNIAHLDFGNSIFHKRPVFDLVLERLPASVELAALACLVAFALGLPLGIAMALRANTWLDKVLSSLSLVGLSIPTFWLAIVLITLLSVTYPLLPVSGRLSGSIVYLPITGFVTIDSLLTGNWAQLRDGLAHAAMPTFALGIVLAGSIARVTRASVIGVLNADYIRFAEAKGLGSARIILVHVLKNAMVPVITIAAIEFGSLIGGAVVTETIFGWPGIGRLAIEAVNGRDYPLVQACILIMAFLFIVSNTAADLICAALNPKIELS